MTTVKELKERVRKIAKAKSIGQFTILSEKHHDFWEKLNRLGARNLATHPPEQYPDIDATVELTATEYSDLFNEFLKFHYSL